MHLIEPFYNWLDFYNAADDERSPFFGNQYSELEFSHSVYNYYIHPQWDSIGSATLYAKLLYVCYDKGFCVIELIGEWNDCLYNDIMYLKRNLADILIEQGVNKFILIGENVLNFHYSDDDYYQEWTEEIEDGWIVCLGLRQHVRDEMRKGHISRFFFTEGKFIDIPWRTFRPEQLLLKIEQLIGFHLPG